MNRLVLIASLFTAACASKAAPATEPTPPTPEEPPPGPLAPGQWASMDKQARAEFMGKAVVPRMGALFREFDPAEFPEMKCKTCHGKGAEDKTFKMPNPDLPALSGKMIQNPDADHKAIVEFMMTKVKPQMAQLLGLPEYSQSTPDGFGCFHCHTQQK